MGDDLIKMDQSKEKCKLMDEEFQDFGVHVYEFADFLKAAGQKYWQVLPLGPTSYGDSPYQSFSTFAGHTTTKSLLFPMEKVFESYVAKSLKRAVADTRWTIKTQARGKYLFEYPCRKFALRPDILVTREDKKQIILDTKWKRLFDDPGRNYGISQSDMYQMFAYAHRYETSEIWLLYPKNEEPSTHRLLVFRLLLHHVPYSVLFSESKTLGGI